jgi:hypothetical protein
MAKKVENHSERAHAVLSASGASRWLNCTPSAKMSEGIVEEASPHAEEGTLAHEISENILRHKLGFITEKEFNAKTMELRRHPMFTTDIEFEVGPYIEIVLEQIAEARATTPDALILIEEKVSLEVYIENGFGTCDLIIIADDLMWVIDLKFGKGVRVSAIDNSQLKLYAVGAVEKYSILYDITTVRLMIVQPRLDAVSVWDIPTTELIEWAEGYVKPQAKLAYAGEGEHMPGDWCRFCKAKVHCPALKKEALEFAAADFNAEEPGTDLELLEVFEKSDRITNYLEAVKDHIYKEALAGKKFPGYKLVEGRSNRKIVDEQKAMTILQTAGYDELIYLNKIVKLKGLGDLEKNLGKANMGKYLGEVIVKPEGKPALVPESDKRPELNSADDFLQ